jgi:hypothetical protein
MADRPRVAGGALPLDVPGPGVPPVPDVTPADVRKIQAALDDGPVGGDHLGPQAGQPGALSTIRAAAIRALCLGQLDADVQQGIRLHSVRVEGRLDLANALLNSPVSFVDCEFDDAIDLTEARATSVVRLERCSLTSLIADRMRTEDDLVVQDSRIKGTLSLVQMQSAGSVRCPGTLIDADADCPALDGVSLRVAGSILLDQGFRAHGEVRLTSAHVDGDLSLDRAVCSNPGGKSINASWLVVGGEMLCQPDFRSEGEVFLQWAQLRALRATGAEFINDGGNAITADGVRVATGLFLDIGMHAKGKISLVEAKADGELNCTGSTLEAPGGSALDATRFETREIYLNCGFAAEGAVELGGAKVRGQLNCSGGRFSSKERCALDLGGLSCDGDVYLGKGFHASGQVRLTRATVQRELNCSGGLFENPAPEPGRTSRALDAEGLTTAGSVYLNDNFRAAGEVFLFRSNIGQQLDCAGGVMDNAGGTALELSGARVQGDIRLIDGFRAVGEVRLSQAFVGQHLDCQCGEFRAGHDRKIMNASGLRVGGSFIWLPSGTPAGLMDLSYATVGRLHDAHAAWPSNQQLELTGFAYGSLESDTPLRDRLTWLAGAKTYSLQAYQQLVTVYRQDGREKEARSVAVQMHRRRRAFLPWWSRAWSWFQDVTVGYGYRPYKALIIVLVLGIIGSVLFRYAQYHNLMLATDAHTPGTVKANRCTQNYPCFTPYVYSFQLLLPIVNLNQTDYWLPNSWTGYGVLLLIYTWFAIVLGWMLGVALLAGLGRVFSRD